MRHVGLNRLGQFHKLPPDRREDGPPLDSEQVQAAIPSYELLRKTLAGSREAPEIDLIP